MMKRVSVVLSAALLTAFFAAGCATGGAAKDEKEPQVLPDPAIPAEREPEAKAAAEKLALGMAEALKTGDYEKFRAVQPKGGRPIPAGVFLKLHKSLSKNYGKLTRAEYFGKLDQGKVGDYLWKFVFASKEEGGKTGHREIVYWVRVGFAKGAPVVYGYRFDFH